MHLVRVLRWPHPVEAVAPVVNNLRVIHLPSAHLLSEFANGDAQSVATPGIRRRGVTARVDPGSQGPHRPFSFRNEASAAPALHERREVCVGFAIVSPGIAKTVD